MGTVILTIVVFCAIILIHEMGHFIAAKACGVRVLEFSLGMGPTIFKYQKKQENIVLDVDAKPIPNENTKYSVRLFPIGGYVSMEGEDEGSLDEKAFCNKKPWQRLIIVCAGAMMNLVLGFVVLFIAYSSLSAVPTTIIAQFNDDATSNSYGLEVGDKICSINSNITLNDGDIVMQMLQDDDGIMDFVVKRDGEKITLSGVTFQTEDDTLNIDFKVESTPKNILSLSGYTLSRELTDVRMVVDSLVQIITGEVGFEQMSGPVGVGSIIGEAASISIQSLLTLIGFLTVNIGVFNLLPLPALDGGRAIFIILEMIRRKPINPKYEGMVHGIGIMVLLGFMILVTFKDIIALF